jgi:hypothetical protein
MRLPDSLATSDPYPIFSLPYSLSLSLSPISLTPLSYPAGHLMPIPSLHTSYSLSLGTVSHLMPKGSHPSPFSMQIYPFSPLLFAPLSSSL